MSEVDAEDLQQQLLKLQEERYESGESARLKKRARLAVDVGQGSGSGSTYHHHRMDPETLRRRMIKYYPAYVTPAEDVVMLYTGSLKRSCKPLFVHQMFPSNNVVGYKSLEVRLYYSPANLHMSGSATYTSHLRDDAQPDKLWQLLGPALAEPFHKLKEGEEWVPDTPAFTPPGTRILVYKAKGSTFEVFRWQCTTEELVAYHKRMETLAMWFIDGASGVDIGHPEWFVFGVYEKSRQGAGAPTYTFAGYMTTVDIDNPFRAVKPKTMRICQVVVLPCYQRRGICKQLVNLVYDFAKSRNCFEVTVEDPAPGFARVRDIVDLQRLQESAVFASAISEQQPGSQALVDKARAVVPITKPQCQKVYEMLSLRSVDFSDEDAYKAFRLQVKKRLFVANRSALVKYEAEDLKSYLLEEYESLEREYLDLLAAAGLGKAKKKQRKQEIQK